MRIQPHIQWIPANDRQILQAISQTIALSSPTPRLILIAGASCSGKTTIAHWLADRISRTTVISLDDYYLDDGDPNLPPYGGKYPTFDMPESYHWAEVDRDLRSLMARQDTHIPIYDITSNSRTKHRQLIKGDRDAYIIEGLYAFRVGLPAFKIFVDATSANRYQRRYARDTQNLPDVPAEVIDGVARRVEVAATDLILPQLLTADLVLNSDTERSWS